MSLVSAVLQVDSLLLSHQGSHVQLFCGVSGKKNIFMSSTYFASVSVFPILAYWIICPWGWRPCRPHHCMPIVPRTFNKLIQYLVIECEPYIKSLELLNIRTPAFFYTSSQ